MREFDVGARGTTWLELFFDLCFVAAVAALADGLVALPTLGRIAAFAGLFVTVWWAWMSFTWFSTAWDNDDVIHRLGMLTAMFLVVVLAAAVPGVYRGNDALYVLAYASMQGVIVLMFLRVLPWAGEARRFVTIYLFAHLTSGLLWLASLAVPQPGRYGIWALAVLVDLVMPVFAVRAYPGQPFDSRHIPERYGLFTIIVLGEGVVAVAIGLGQRGALDATGVTTAALGFAIAALIWWSYFETVSSDPLSRDQLATSFLWGYGHFFAFAGIAAAASGVELAIDAAAEGQGYLGLATRLMLVGGIASFLFALVAVHSATVRGWDAVLTQRSLGMAALLVLIVAGRGLDPPVFTGAVAAVLLITTVLDVVRAGGQGLAADHIAPPTDEIQD
jgi:low temperature requirement protein LtrA